MCDFQSAKMIKDMEKKLFIEPELLPILFADIRNHYNYKGPLKPIHEVLEICQTAKPSKTKTLQTKVAIHASLAFMFSVAFYFRKQDCYQSPWGISEGDRDCHYARNLSYVWGTVLTTMAVDKSSAHYKAEIMELAGKHNSYRVIIQMVANPISVLVDMIIDDAPITDIVKQTKAVCSEIKDELHASTPQRPSGESASKSRSRSRSGTHRIFT